jgi:glycosyltransferase involved in cell wall biosynthesis
MSLVGQEIRRPVWSATIPAINRAADLCRRGKNMEIHALCIVKNEADILQESLIAALHWCDHIYVFDNGSSDGSWELVKELSQQYSQIVAYKQDDILYSNGLRADIFNAFRSNASLQDWWCALDADEFYIDDPRIFLAKIPSHLQTVWSASLNYYFTDQDTISYQQDPVKFLQTPVQQRFAITLITGVNCDFSGTVTILYGHGLKVGSRPLCSRLLPVLFGYG